MINESSTDILTRPKRISKCPTHGASAYNLSVLRTTGRKESEIKWTLSRWTSNLTRLTKREFRFVLAFENRPLRSEGGCSKENLEKLNPSRFPNTFVRKRNVHRYLKSGCPSRRSGVILDLLGREFIHIGITRSCSNIAKRICHVSSHVSQCELLKYEKSVIIYPNVVIQKWGFSRSLRQTMDDISTTVCPRDEPSPINLQNRVTRTRDRWNPCFIRSLRHYLRKNVSPCAFLINFPRGNCCFYVWAYDQCECTMQAQDAILWKSVAQTGTRAASAERSASREPAAGGASSGGGSADSGRSISASERSTSTTGGGGTPSTGTGSANDRSESGEQTAPTNYTTTPGGGGGSRPESGLPPPPPQDKPWNYSSLDLINSGAAFWQNYSGKYLALLNSAQQQQQTQFRTTNPLLTSIWKDFRIAPEKAMGLPTHRTLPLLENELIIVNSVIRKRASHGPHQILIWNLFTFDEAPLNCTPTYHRTFICYTRTSSPTNAYNCGMDTSIKPRFDLQKQVVPYLQRLRATLEEPATEKGQNTEDEIPFRKRAPFFHPWAEGVDRILAEETKQPLYTFFPMERKHLQLFTPTEHIGSFRGRVHNSMCALCVYVAEGKDMAKRLRGPWIYVVLFVGCVHNKNPAKACRHLRGLVCKQAVRTTEKDPQPKKGKMQITFNPRHGPG
ncbi:unnamed protein product [Nesidiocoris tenuis]|uniref:Uncharacterized protein n=1 Tax=Nesidiocoris tenuis TaxID=355587 RepID=A0A6H5GFD3_9HEMI|nr:unnamed protein product [Nesidiocoris tenuis]